MRAFGEDFTRLLAEERSSFWTLELDLGGGIGTLRLCDSAGRTSFNGNDYEPIVAAWGEISASASRDEKTMDIPTMTVELSNLRVLSTGERISDLLQGVDLENRRARLYLNLEDRDDGSIYSEKFFEGVIQASDATPVSYDYRRVKLSILPLTEYYLNQGALRVITEKEFPSIRASDIGATIPIVFGEVPRTPGRVAKGGKKTVPTADPDNISNARLRDYNVLPPAVAEDWTIVFREPEEAPSMQHWNGEVNNAARINTTLPTVDVAGSKSCGASEAVSLTQSVTLGSSATELLVGLHIDNGRGGTVPISVTYDGVALSTKAIVVTQDGENGWREVVPVRFSVFRLAFPATGAAHDLVVTLNKAAPFLFNYISFNNAALSWAYALEVNAVGRTYVEATQHTENAPTNVLLVDFADRSEIATGTMSPYPGQTQRTIAATSVSGFGNVRGGISTKPGNNSQPTKMGWTQGTSLCKGWTVVKLIEQIRNVYAQSFSTTSPQQVAAVTLKLRVNPAAGLNGGTATAIVGIYADSGGAPSGEPLGRAFFVFRETTFRDCVFAFSGVTLSGNSTYWIVLMNSGSLTGTVGNINWAKNNGNVAGSYAGGTAAEGRWAGTNWLTGQWADMTNEDFVFKVTYVGLGAGYDIYGSVTGWDGTGSTAATFLSNSGALQIGPEHWQGIPAAGDRFYFSVDPTPSLVIFSESPPATPVEAIDAVWWDGVKMEDSSPNNLDDDVGTAWTIGPNGYERIAQPFEVLVGLVAKQVTVVLAKVGFPAAPLNLSIYPAAGGSLTTFLSDISRRITGDGQIPADGAIASTQIASSDVASSYAELSGLFSQPVVLPPGKYFLVASAQSQLDDQNYYSLHKGDTAPGIYTDAGGAITKASPSSSAVQLHQVTEGWNDDGTGQQMLFEVTAVSVNTTASGDDGTGNYVAKVTFDVDIPEAAKIAADLRGITDDTEGKYAGVASALVTRPDAVIHWLLNLWGVPDEEIDLDESFAEAAILYANLYALEGTLQQDVTRKATVLQLGFESRGALSWFGGKARWNFIPLQLLDVDATVEFADLVPEEINPIITVRRMPTKKVVNWVDVRYQRRQDEPRNLTAYDRIVNAQNLQSIDGILPDGSDAFGKRDNPELFLFDFVRDDEMALVLATYYAERLGFPLRAVDFTTKLHRAALESDDRVNFDLRTA